MIYGREIIRYDFDEFLDAFQSMLARGEAHPNDLRNLKVALNRFFKDSECKEVIYTNNNDRMFFGMKIMPIIDPDDIYEYLMEEDEKIRIGKYIVEIDSHLLNPVLDIQADEMMAILLHEVGHLVGDAMPVENARKALNTYLLANKETIKISQSIHYKEILAYGLKDYLSKSSSMFYTEDASEILADDMAHAYGYEHALEEAYKKITKNNFKLYENSAVSKFITFGWVLSTYKSLRIRRVDAIKTLNRAILLTGSRLEKMEMENVIRRIKRIDDDIVVEAAAMEDAAKESGIRLKIKDKLRKNRLNNLRTIDNTFYELNMQVRNVEDEADALYLVRQINNSMAIIDEYRNHKDCDEWEFKQWSDAYDRFYHLRDKLTNSVVYKNKQYGVFVAYPDIVENRYS